MLFSCSRIHLQGIVRKVWRRKTETGRAKYRAFTVWIRATISSLPRTSPLASAKPSESIWNLSERSVASATPFSICLTTLTSVRGRSDSAPRHHGTRRARRSPPYPLLHIVCNGPLYLHRALILTPADPRTTHTCSRGSSSAGPPRRATPTSSSAAAAASKLTSGGATRRGWL